MTGKTARLFDLGGKSAIVTGSGRALGRAMVAGSALLWLGSTWHGAGANVSARARIGLYAGYLPGWLRQEETLFLAPPPAAVRPTPERLQRLIGYELKGTLTLGRLDGRDPREVPGLDT